MIKQRTPISNRAAATIAFGSLVSTVLSTLLSWLLDGCSQAPYNYLTSLLPLTFTWCLFVSVALWSIQTLRQPEDD